MADALDLKSSEGNLVRVQVSLPALRQRGAIGVSALLAHGKTCGTWKRQQVTVGKDNYWKEQNIPVINKMRGTD